MIVLLQRVDICTYCLTFLGVAIFCGFLFFKPVLIDLENILYCLGYFLLPLYISGKSNRLKQISCIKYGLYIVIVNNISH